MAKGQRGKPQTTRQMRPRWPSLEEEMFSLKGLFLFLHQNMPKHTGTLWTPQNSQGSRRSICAKMGEGTGPENEEQSLVINVLAAADF